MDAKPDPLYRKSIEIPKRLNLKNDPRQFYAFVSEKVVNMIRSYPFSAVELCPGPNFHPMNFLADAAGNNLSSYTAIELVPETVKFLEGNKASRRIQVVRRGIQQEVAGIGSGKKRYDLLVLSGLQPGTVENVLKKLHGKVRFILVYAQDASVFSAILPSYALTLFSFPGEKPSALFAALK